MTPREREKVAVMEKTLRKKLREVEELHRKRPSNLQQLSSLKVRVVKRRKRTEARKRKKKRRLSLNLPP